VAAGCASGFCLENCRICVTLGIQCADRFNKGNALRCILTLHKGDHVKNTCFKMNSCSIILIMFLIAGTPVWSQEDTPAANGALSRPVLTEAVMCEDIQKYSPVNRAVTFGTDIGQVVCFTAFEKIHSKMFIYHSWFRRDVLITSKRLTLNPPEWASFSKILLRQADIGPWRVEIHDQEGNIMQILRFSITE
jgi:hypothetical protein